MYRVCPAGESLVDEGLLDDGYSEKPLGEYQKFGRETPSSADIILCVNNSKTKENHLKLHPQSMSRPCRQLKTKGKSFATTSTKYVTPLPTPVSSSLVPVLWNATAAPR